MVWHWEHPARFGRIKKAINDKMAMKLVGLILPKIVLWNDEGKKMANRNTRNCSTMFMGHKMHNNNSSSKSMGSPNILIVFGAAPAMTAQPNHQMLSITFVLQPCKPIRRWNGGKAQSEWILRGTFCRILENSRSNCAAAAKVFL